MSINKIRKDGIDYDIGGDTLPVGTIVDYEGDTVPEGYVEVDDENNYSTEETRIGTWIDGKPLYRKVFSFKFPYSSYQSSFRRLTYETNLANIDISFLKIAYCKSLDINIPQIFVSTDRYIKYSVLTQILNKSSIILEIGTERDPETYCNYDFVYVLEYTKTTD